MVGRARGGQPAGRFAVVWLFLAAPDRAKSHLAKANTWVTWVKSHGDLVIRIILTVVGAALVISGATGLASS
jgi:hypothetical protein